MLDAKRKIVEEQTDEDWLVQADGMIVCPCGHRIEDDGECPNGHVSPMKSGLPL